MCTAKVQISMAITRQAVHLKLKFQLPLFPVSPPLNLKLKYHDLATSFSRAIYLRPT